MNYSRDFLNGHCCSWFKFVHELDKTSCKKGFYRDFQLMYEMGGEI